MPDSSPWQETLDPPFVQRLLRPWRHPGRIDPRMTNAILARYQPMTPLPLVEHLTRRQNRIATLPSASPPIVYAQPSPPAPVTRQAVTTPIAHSQPIGSPTIIQAKFVSSSAAATLLSAKQPATGQPEPLRIQAQSEPLSPAFERRLAGPSDLSSLTPNPSGRSHPTTPSLPDLPLIPSGNPSTATTSPPPLRPRRPRFERDIGRPIPNTVADLNSDSADQDVPAIPSLPSPPTTPLPLASTAAPDLSLPRSAQSFHPTERNILLVSVGVSQPQEPDNRSERPVVVRSRHGIEAAIATTTPTKTSGQLQEKAASPLTLVQVFNSMGVPGQPVIPPGAMQPLVFSTPASSAIGGGTSPNSLSDAGNPMSLKPVNNGHSREEPGRSTGKFAPSSQSIPVVNAQPQMSQQPAVDVDALADKVERKLMRRLVVERERRGWSG